MIAMTVAGTLQLVSLLTKVVSGIATAVELNQTSRLPALRAHAARIEAMIAAGTEPAQGDIDLLAGQIQGDIDTVRKRAQEALAGN